MQPTGALGTMAAVAGISEAVYGASAQSRSEAGTAWKLQAEQRSRFAVNWRGTSSACTDSARACARAVIGREEPDPSS